MTEAPGRTPLGPTAEDPHANPSATDRSSPDLRSTVRTGLILLGSGAGYLAAAKLGLLLAVSNASVSVFWPASGVAIALFLVLGYDVWPAIAVASFLANVWTTGDPWSSIVIAGGDTLEGLVAAYLTIRFARGTRFTEQPRDILIFLGLGALVATSIAATIGAAALVAAHLASIANYSSLWSTWWLGDAVGALEFTPLLILLAQGRNGLRRAIAGRTAGETFVVALVVSLLSGVVFLTSAFPYRGVSGTALLLLPPVLWAALRYRSLGAAVSATAVSLVAITGTVLGRGPFAAMAPLSDLFSLRLYIGSIIAAALLAAAEVLQHEKAEEAAESARQNLEEKVRERTKLLSDAEAIARLGSWDYDLSTGKITWSDEMFEIYGFGKERFEVTLEKAYERTVSEDREMSQAGLRQIASDPKALSAPESASHFRIRLPTGEVRWVIGRGKVVEVRDGKPVRMVGTAQDDTERMALISALKQREAELVRSNRELQQFAYVASHDLQEPLRMVASFTQLLQTRYQDRLDAEANEFINYATEGAKRMSQLIDDLLAYSRLNRSAAPWGDVNLNEVFDLALTNLLPAIQESHAEVARGELPTVQGDRTQLLQLFQNLAGNAIKFHGELRPWVRCSAVQEEGSWHFVLEDHGIGIAPEYHERIFAIFQRLHTRQEYPGTGIGLAICKKVVERHGGRIWVESSGEAGKGSRFHFTLPLHAATGASSTPPPGVPRGLATTADPLVERSLTGPWRAERPPEAAQRALSQGDGGTSSLLPSDRRALPSSNPPEKPPPPPGS
ncbi:MAG: MASE1 domain-containing protein [Euryarchaeota archaeon]|nr:MASE1 domain-containing protein [Euryarchaeota archaeon]MDE1837895.1 MASE1 domain-containing protein [Euryarchaeota archaeon]MDE1881301.1 MASE1 domain-containing protein [Euryarchaeota archaeon]MDE2046241.1 MASE1 domain-containing protein [Thermoplasmata archaeon]